MSGGKFPNLGRTPGASIGSKATPSAMKKAMSTASGSSPRTSSLSSQSQDISAFKPKTTIHPGSSAGLNNSKTVHLTANGSGYLNPSNQSARLKNRTKVVDISPPKQPTIYRATNRVYDNRLTSSDKSSISLLQKRSR